MATLTFNLGMQICLGDDNLQLLAPAILMNEFMTC
jgi:hypothetical protein